MEFLYTKKVYKNDKKYFLCVFIRYKMYSYIGYVGILLLLVVVIVLLLPSSSQNTPIHGLILSSIEFGIPNTPGILVSSKANGIRVAGTSNTSSIFSSAPTATANQIQMFSNNNCVGAFDVSGLIIPDALAIQIGNTSSYLSLSHSGTSCTMNSTNPIVFGTSAIPSLLIWNSTGVTFGSGVILNGASLSCSGTLTSTNLYANKVSSNLTLSTLTCGTLDISSAYGDGTTLTNFNAGSSKIFIKIGATTYTLANAILQAIKQLA